MWNYCCYKKKDRSKSEKLNYGNAKNFDILVL